MSELKKNVAWVRRETPVLHADGVFAQTITMNPCAYVEHDTIYLFYAGDDETGRRQLPALGAGKGQAIYRKALCRRPF